MQTHVDLGESAIPSCRLPQPLTICPLLDVHLQGVIMNMPAAIDQEHYNGRQQTTTWARVNALCVTQQHQMRVEVSDCFRKSWSVSRN